MQRSETETRVGVEARDVLLLPRDVAHMLRSSTSTLAKMRMRGDGPPFVRIGGRVLYRVDDVAAYLDRNTCVSTLDDKPATAA